MGSHPYRSPAKDALADPLRSMNGSRPSVQAMRFAQRFVAATEILLLVLAIAGTVKSLRAAVERLSVPYGLNFEEGNQLDAALRVAHAQDLYPPVGRPPYIVHPYGPIFYLADGALVRLFGVSFAPGRTLVLLAGMGIAGLVMALLRRNGVGWGVAAGFGLSFLAVPLVRTWLPLLRVDLPGLLLTLLGIYSFSEGRRILIPALCFLAALFTKPTFLAAPLACLLYFAIRRRWRPLWQLGAALVVGGGVGLGGLAIATRGWALFHMFLAFPDPYSLRFYGNLIAPFAIRNLPWMVGVALLVREAWRNGERPLPLLYVLLATLATLTAGKWGSDANHFLEWQAALCWAGGLGYWRYRSHAVPEMALGLLPLLMAAVIGVGLTENTHLSPLLADCPTAYRWARETPGEVLSENPAAAVLAGKTVWISNAFEYASLGRAGRLDPQPLVQQVRQKFFSLVLLRDDPVELERRARRPLEPLTIWPLDFVLALRRNYQLVGRFSCAGANFAYQPRHTTPAEMHHMEKLPE